MSRVWLMSRVDTDQISPLVGRQLNKFQPSLATMERREWIQHKLRQLHPDYLTSRFLWERRKIRDALMLVKFIDDGTVSRRAAASEQRPYYMLYRCLERKDSIPAWLAEAVRLLYHNNTYPEYLTENFIRQGWDPAKVNLPGLAEAERRRGVPILQLLDDGTAVTINQPKIKREPGMLLWDGGDSGICNSVETEFGRRSGSSSTLTPPSECSLTTPQPRVKAEPDDNIALPYVRRWDSIGIDRTIKEEPTENKMGVKAYPEMFPQDRLLSLVRGSSQHHQKSTEPEGSIKAIKKESTPVTRPRRGFRSAVEFPKLQSGMSLLSRFGSGPAGVQRESTIEYQSSRHRGNSVAYISEPSESPQTSTRVKREGSLMPFTSPRRKVALPRRPSPSGRYPAAARTNTPGTRKIKEEKEKEDDKGLVFTF